MRPLKRAKALSVEFEYIDFTCTFPASCGESVLHQHPLQRTGPQMHHCGPVHLFTPPLMKSAPKPCNKPGCGVLVRDGSARCDKHKPAAWAKKPNATKRITGRRLQAMRAELFNAYPLCAECERQGLVSLATQRDHIKPLEEGGTDDCDNEQGLCVPCHAAKSLQERIRAQRRSRF